MNAQWGVITRATVTGQIVDPHPDAGARQP
jgi:hypothetical protein